MLAGYTYFEYDVLANHLFTIIHHAIDPKHWKNGIADIDAAMGAAARVINRDIYISLHDMLNPPSGPRARLFLHIDGLPSLAKETEQQKRLKRKDAARLRLAHTLWSLQKKGNNAPTKLRDDADKELSKAFQLSMTYKSALKTAFRKLGLLSHVCHAETDPCIADKCLKHSLSLLDGKRAVVSKDSDLIVYESVDAVLHPNPKDTGYILYEKQKVLEVLGLRHPIFLVMYGIGL